MRSHRRLASGISTLMLVALTAWPFEAAMSQDTPRWVGPSAIDLMSVQPNGRIYVKLAMSTPDLGCPANHDGFLELNPSYPRFDEQYALLLAAHAANRTVRIYVNGCGYYPYAQNTEFF